MTRKMKDSGVEWIGEIPEGWEVVPLKYIAHLNSESLKETTPKDFIFDYLDIGSVTYENGICALERMEFEKAPSRARRIVREGDIVISTVRTYLKAIAEIPFSDVPIIASTGFAVIRTRGHVVQKFLMYSVQSEAFISEIEKRSTGVNYPAINTSELMQIPVVIPPKKEQLKITEYLSNIISRADRSASQIQQQIVILDNYKKSLITETVTKGLNKNAPMKDSGIEWVGEIPESWECPRLKTIVIDSQSGIWGEDEDNKVATNNRICLRVADFDYDRMSIKNTGEFTRRKYTAAEIARYRLRKDDILIEKSGGGEKTPVGRSVIWDGRFDALYANFIQRLRVDVDQVIPMFVQYCFYSFYNQGGSKFYFNQTIGIQNLNMSLFLNRFRLPKPSLDEQEDIVVFLDAAIKKIDLTIEQKYRQLQTLEDYKKSIIYEYVTGKKEVPHD